MQSSLLLRSCVIDVPKFTRRCRSRSSNSLTPVNTVSPKIGSFAKASLFSCNKISCADQNNLFRNLRRRPPRLPKACDAEHLPGPLALSQRLLRNVDWSLSRHDVDIFRLAIPALCSTLLDPLMGLVDTGELSLLMVYAGFVLNTAGCPLFSNLSFLQFLAMRSLAWSPWIC